MYKPVLALLVGLMLSVSGSAWGEYTFKDGVISSDNVLKNGELNKVHSPIEDSYKTALRYKNKKFKEFRKLTIHSKGQKAVTVTGFNQWKGFGGWKAEGIFFFGEEICSWNSKITSSDGTGRFKAACPSLEVEGNYKVAGIKSGSSGQGQDGFGRHYRFVLGPASDSREVRYKALLNLYLAKNEVALTEYFADSTGFIKSITGRSSTARDKALNELSPNYTATNNAPNKLESTDLKNVQQKALKLEQELAALKAQQQQQQKTISSDTQVPLITITSASSNGPQGTINGRVTDNTGVGEVRVDGQLVALDGNGGFTANTYVPEGGVSVTVEAFDLAGLSSSMFVQLDRVVTQTAAITFDRLNPLGKQVKPNKDALALIVGVADYENTPAKAIFADSDALTFRDYASEKLGIPENRIKTLVDDGAGERELLLAVKSWITRSVKQEQSDVYVFFAGHGLASDDGSQMYLLPYDGAPELLEETTISREKLFTEVAAANPRSVTVFLDTCYSGQTRNEEMLIASRPLVLVPKQQAVPDNFTVMTAAAGDQTAKPLEEAKHGMFSYFLMKGMEGEADANQDNKITAGELHAYVEHNVDQQSSGSQTPELQGDADRVLVQFQ